MDGVIFPHNEANTDISVQSSTLRIIIGRDWPGGAAKRGLSLLPTNALFEEVFFGALAPLVECFTLLTYTRRGGAVV